MIFSYSELVIWIIYMLVLYLTVFWLLVLFDKQNIKKGKVKKYPLVSILIPAYNEENTIIKTLKSVVNLDYPKNKLQIIVINDGSKDKTESKVKDFIKKHLESNIKLISQVNKGKGAALNTALKTLKCKYFATLDADSTVATTTLKRMIPYFADKEVASVLPLMKIKNPQTILQRVQRYEYIINMFYKHLNGKLDSVHVTPGPFSMYKYEVIKKLGYYDENNLTEDLEIAIRLQKHHYKIIQTNDAEVYTECPKDLKSLYWQRNRWYKGGIFNSINYKKLWFNKEYGDFGFIRMPTIFLSGILSVIVLFIFIYELIKSLVQSFAYLKSINFDIITMIRNFSLDFILLDLNLVKLFVPLFVLSLAVIVMIYSHRFSRERITRYGKTLFSMAYYLMLYGLFLSFVWLNIFMDLARRKTQKW